MKLSIDDRDVEVLAERVAEILYAKLADRLAPAVSVQPAKVYWTEKEAADCLGVSSFTLREWRQKGFIEAATAARPIMYTRLQIDAAAEWMARRGDAA